MVAEFHLRFVCGLAEGGDLHPIWEEFARGRGRMEGMYTLNQALIRGLQSCRRVFEGRDHLSASLPLINVILLNPSLDPYCTGGGFTTRITRHGSVEASTRGGANSSLLAHQLDGRLDLVDLLRLAVSVRLEVIRSVF